MIKLSIGEFNFYASAETRDEVAELMKAGFHPDKNVGGYKTKLLSAVAKFKSYLNENQRPVFWRYFIFTNEKVYDFATTKLFDFQIPAAKWALSRNRAYLALAPGAGKTAIAYTVMNLDPGKTLIVCPAYLIYMWSEGAWANFGMAQEPFVIDFGPNEFNSERERKFFDAEVVFIADSRLMDYHVLLTKIKWHRLIVDEGHRFKNRSSLRGTAMWGRTIKSLAKSLAWSAKNVLVLSGTPIPNRPMELFPMLQTLAPEVIDFMDRDGFGMKFCGGFFDGLANNFNGSSLEAELNERLTREFMFVISRENLKVHLPPLLEEIVLIGNQAQLQIQKLEGRVRKEFNGDVAKILEAMDEHPHIATLRKMIGIQTAVIASQIIRDMLEENPNQKVVLFAHHKEVVEKIAFALFEFGVVVIDGSTSTHIRQNLADQFQIEPAKRVLLGNLDAMGEGLTITKNISYVGILEPAWSPTKNWQAIDRVHRITQTEPCVAQYFILRGTLSVDIANAFIRKAKTINSIIKERSVEHS